MCLCVERVTRVDGARAGYEIALGAHVRRRRTRVSVELGVGCGAGSLRAGRSAAALLAGPLLAMLLSRQCKHKP